ncbi:MAG TPA: DUF861 domain-containing protein [Chromatiaceae bacterium]|jgi:uncharacterized cupin superfamily protein|nr:DUF861 domain-containing protein [Chromatiaceae bacterium]HIA09191.1 DUF861 domain-containing protein [Chromatiaceae bacterium]HIN81546.1 DUF861 domain-containing protein [Chromatiales bacterium]HIO15148.1 DUF861 domain-containing protein [Chromatiales bacterium]HIO53557.1 DUF861 domain-containing protein [Chromatiales bacterium]
MTEITIEHNVPPPKLDVLAVEVWPIWEKEISTFDWTYDEEETCYLLRGEARISYPGAEPVVIKRGDLVIFEKGLTCTWEILKPVKKHYKLESW